MRWPLSNGCSISLSNGLHRTLKTYSLLIPYLRKKCGHVASWVYGMRMRALVFLEKSRRKGAQAAATT